MTYLIGFPLLALAAVLQSSVLARFPILGGTFDLVLLLTLNWTLIGEWQGGAVWGFIGGLCLDLLSGGPLGANAAGLVLMAYFASLTEGRFWRSHVLLPLATSLLGTLGFHAVYLMTLSATGHPVNWSASLSRVTLPAVLLNTACTLPVYHVLRGLHALVYPAPVTI